MDNYRCVIANKELIIKKWDEESKNIEILKDIETKEIIKLEELIPDWWGYDRV